MQRLLMATAQKSRRTTFEEIIKVVSSEAKLIYLQEKLEIQKNRLVVFLPTATLTISNFKGQIYIGLDWQDDQDFRPLNVLSNIAAASLRQIGINQLRGDQLLVAKLQENLQKLNVSEKERMMDFTIHPLTLNIPVKPRYGLLEKIKNFFLHQK